MALKPATPIEPYEDLLPELDMLLVMTVEPGLRRPEVPRPVPAQDPPRPRADRQARPRDLWLQVDGGVSLETIERCAEAGADVFVAGSAVFGADDPDAMVEALRATRRRGRAPARRPAWPGVTSADRRATLWQTGADE